MTVHIIDKDKPLKAETIVLDYKRKKKSEPIYMEVFKLLKIPNKEDFFEWRRKVVRVVEILGMDEDLNYLDPKTSFLPIIKQYVKMMIAMERIDDKINLPRFKQQWVKACMFLINHKQGEMILGGSYIG